MLFLLVTLSVFSVLIYGTLRATLYDDLDDLLSSRAEGIANSINAYWQTEQHSDENKFVAMAGNWLEEKRKDRDLMNVSSRILNVQAETIASARSMPKITPPDKEDLRDLLNGEEDFSTAYGTSIDNKRKKFRIYTRPVVEDGATRYIVQVASPVELVSLALSNLVLVLFILLPLTVLLAGIPSVLLVGLTLRPVEKMIKTLKQITAENLKLKIHLPDTKDEIKELAETFNDMIDRLERSFSLQQRFIREIAEDLKDPMTAIREDIADVLEKDHSPEESRTLLSRLFKETEDLAKTVDNLMLVGAMDEEQRALEIKKINLNTLLGKSIALIKEKALEKNITTTLHCSGDIALDGDQSQLEALFLNILDNAVKYTYRKGSVAVVAYRDGKYAKVDISDTGIGIPHEEINYIFDRFYKISNSRSANRGFGLGLSAAKSIVDAHKGAITVESRYGKGSTFTVSLPLSYPG